LFVTEVEINRILSLDGKPPLSVLRELYEQLDPRDRELLQHSLFLGITMQNAQSSYRQGDFLIRNILGIEADSGAMAAAVFPQQNSVVQFHLRDAQTSADDLTTLLQRFAMQPATKPPSGSLLFSCLGRGIHLYGEPHHDSKIFQRYLGEIPLGGFFCNGEIGPVQGTTFLHGYTSAFALFSPK
jgi:small ligand-binding sensory domain FIST